MYKQHIEGLITRYLDGSPLSNIEREELLDWLKASEEHRAIFVEEWKLWTRNHRCELQIDTDEAMNKVLSRTQQTAQTMRMSHMRGRYIRLAIAGAVAACIAVIGLRWLASPDIDFETYIERIGPVEFTQGKVTLQLSDRNTVFIDAGKADIRYDLAAITVDSMRTFDIHAADKYNCLTVPYGKQGKLTLCDGTKVWINAGSYIMYPSSFDELQRHVYVGGEVYFEVAKDMSRPFIVNTDKMFVKVLGTHFYLNTKHDINQEVVLLEGSVSVSSIKQEDSAVCIKPNQRATLGMTEEIVVDNVNANESINWINGYLNFVNTPLKEVVRQLSHYYNRKISCTPDASLLTFSGKLELNNDFNQVIQLLEHTAPIIIHADPVENVLLIDVLSE